MKKFRYLKISDTKKLRYIDNYYKNNLYIVFLPGFMSDIDGKKPKAFKKYAIKNKFILVGSSMGVWISLNQFKYFKKQIFGFVGIGSAPEFLEKLMWKKFTKKMKKEIKTKGIITIRHGQSNFRDKLNEYPITYQLIKDGRKNKVLSKKIRSKIKVSMIHGGKDEVVPVSFSRKSLSLFPNAQKKLVIIKGGDHSLSNQVPLKKIIKELKSVVKDVI